MKVVLKPKDTNTKPTQNPTERDPADNRRLVCAGGRRGDVSVPPHRPASPRTAWVRPRPRAMRCHAMRRRTRVGPGGGGRTPPDKGGGRGGGWGRGARSPTALHLGSGIPSPAPLRAVSLQRSLCFPPSPIFSSHLRLERLEVAPAAPHFSPVQISDGSLSISSQPRPDTERGSAHPSPSAGAQRASAPPRTGCDAPLRTPSVPSARPHGAASCARTPPTFPGSVGALLGGHKKPHSGVSGASAGLHLAEKERCSRRGAPSR